MVRNKAPDPWKVRSTHKTIGAARGVVTTVLNNLVRHPSATPAFAKVMYVEISDLIDLDATIADKIVNAEAAMTAAGQRMDELEARAAAGEVEDLTIKKSKPKPPKCTTCKGRGLTYAYEHVSGVGTRAVAVFCLCPKGVRRKAKHEKSEPSRIYGGHGMKDM